MAQLHLLNEPRVEVAKHSPAISIMLPFEPKMTPRAELREKFKDMIDQVRGRLKEYYSPKESFEVMRKLNKMIAELDYLTHKKSIAFFVSPVFEKIYYLDVDVNAAFMIDEHFGLTQLIENKKETQQYLLLVLSGELTKIYLGQGGHPLKMISHAPKHVNHPTSHLPEKVSNFTDASHIHEIELKKFLRSCDDGLTLLLNAYPLPLFVMGPKKTVGYFKHLSRNTNHVVEYLYGNYIHSSQAEIDQAMTSHLMDWNQVKQKDILNRLEVAAGSGKLARGIHEVWREAGRKKAKLLVIEKNHTYPFRNSRRVPGILNDQANTNNQFHIRDGVDQLIEEVLESGGEIEFVEEGFLKDYDHIALVLHY
jgi:hypothetical protein